MHSIPNVVKAHKSNPSFNGQIVIPVNFKIGISKAQENEPQAAEPTTTKLQQRSVAIIFLVIELMKVDQDITKPCSTLSFPNKG